MAPDAITLAEPQMPTTTERVKLRKSKSSGKPRTLQLKELDVLQGVPYFVVESLAGRLGTTVSWIGAALRIPPATMSRRREGQALSLDEGDRVWRLIRVLDRAQSALGDSAKARHWLDNPVRSLGGAVPAQLLVTTAGYEQVMRVLDALDYGMGA